MMMHSSFGLWPLAKTAPPCHTNTKATTLRRQLRNQAPRMAVGRPSHLLILPDITARNHNRNHRWCTVSSPERTNQRGVNAAFPVHASQAAAPAFAVVRAVACSERTPIP